MKEDKIMEFITSEYSWEQIIYQIIAWEGLDPWDLDISRLSDSFVKHISKLKELDFKIPAKYIIIAAILLRMKSDHLDFIDTVEEMYGMQGGEEMEGHGETMETNGGTGGLEISPIAFPLNRRTRRKIMVNELINALRKVILTNEKRGQRSIKRRGQIAIREEAIMQRIDIMYDRITKLLSKMKGDEIKFSALINNLGKRDVVDVFLPVIYLDHHKRIHCSQEEIFDEIYIRKRDGKL